MKKGFTLVELLAVIVILAVILVIAVPQINSVIKQTKKNSLASTAKIIAAKAEEKIVENDALENNEALTCSNLVKLDDNYGNCSVSVTNGVATVTLNGTGKFAGLTCTGTKGNMSCTEESSNTTTEEGIYAFGSISSPSEGETDYRNVKNHRNEPAKVFVKYPASGTYNDSTVKSVCTLYGESLNCFEGASSAYEANKTKLTTLFGDDKCTLYQENEIGEGSPAGILCTDGSWRCGVYTDGYIGFTSDGTMCILYQNGKVYGGETD